MHGGLGISGEIADKVELLQCNMDGVLLIWKAKCAV
jgi:hypothetical protein